MIDEREERMAAWRAAGDVTVTVIAVVAAGAVALAVGLVLLLRR